MVYLNKKLSSLFLGCLLILTLSAFTSPIKAEAIAIKVRNPSSQLMSLVFVYYDNATNDWLVRGWYSVPAKSTKTFNFNGSTKMNTVWIHAYTTEASWGSERKYTVIRQAFKYVAGKTCPNGDARRQVAFDKYYVENNGYVYFNPCKK